MKLKYPKFLLFIATVILAYLIFKNKDFPLLQNLLPSLGYFGSFLSGILFVYGFTAAPATAILLILAKSQNIFLSAIIAGFGSLIGDLIIFKFIRTSFKDEVLKLEKEKIIKKAGKNLGIFKKYFLPVLAGFVIASPLPDEIGVSLLASSKISIKLFSLLSYLLNTSGIFVILVIGKLV